MIVNSFQQACYVWAKHVEDNMGSKLNEHSYPFEESSKETKTVWILKNNFGVLAVIDKQTGEVVT